MDSVLKVKKVWVWVIAAVLVTAAAGTSAYSLHTNTAAVAQVQYKTPEESDVYVRFLMEAYDSIQKNYWKKSTDSDMAMLYQLSLQKALNTPAPPDLARAERASVAAMLAVPLSVATSTEAKKQLTLSVISIALLNLPPVGRNSLMSDAQAVALRQNVSNIHPGKDLYEDLGVAKGASVPEVEAAYVKKEEALKGDTSAQAATERAQITHAREVLADTNTKTLYDTAKIEPTVSRDVIGKTLYINLSKVSPTSLQEFVWSVYAASTTPVDSMILDLRGNVGGALDFLQSFLGFFIGSNQYAFDLYRQDIYEVQRTVQMQFPELARIKEIAILTDTMTQSTAELTAATFKRMRLAKVVGTTSRGWGTVENTYVLETRIDPAVQYALFLVNSITLRDDNQPIEGRGVTPDVDITSPDWKKQLKSTFASPSLIKAVEIKLGPAQ